MSKAPPARKPHLLPAFCALLLAGALVASGWRYCQKLERKYVHVMAPEFTDAKLQGMALQKEAFAQPDLLVLYGSSELVKEMPNNASEFFAEYPTGFRVFPVGKPGATSLIILQKIASVGRELRQRKLAISLSPGWFFTEVFDPKYYEGNFSELQASELAFSSDLSPGLKRDIARRMLEFPRTLENHDFLEFALRRLARDAPFDRFMYMLAWPLGRLDNAVGRAQDHVEVALHILGDDEKRVDAPKREKPLAWTNVLKQAARFANAAAVQRKRNEVIKKHLARASRDKVFIQTVAHAKEWTDVELMMRVIKELGGQPLFLSMPVEDIRLEVYGISNDARAAYSQRLTALASEYKFPLLDFHEHEQDPSFLVDFLDHLSGSGWLFYNKALDDFFHGRTSTL